MNAKNVEVRELLRQDYENKRKNTLTARASLSKNPDSAWLRGNLEDCLHAESLAKQLLEAAVTI